MPLNLRTTQSSGSCFDSCVNNNNSGLSASTRSPNRPHPPDFSRDDQQTKQEMDALIAQTLSGLTFEQRQQQQDMLHGVEEKVAENEALIDCALQSLDQQLQSIKSGSVYEMAERMNLQYVQARHFRVMFLRANEYDAKAAADQMLRFFECKCELFGADLLTKDITMEDFTEGDLASMNLGWMQFAGRDRSGRQILVHCGGLDGFYNSKIMSMQHHFRVQFYTVMKALQSEQTQLLGTVSIWFALGKFRNKSNGKGYSQGYRVAAALPQKRAAIHICVDEMPQYILCNAVLKLMQASMRARMRVHFGSQLECEYQMSSYGIMSPTLPLDANGDLVVDGHLRWIGSCAIDDNATANITAVDHSSTPATTGGLGESELPTRRAFIVIEPSQQDVLFNRGRWNNHGGNKRLRALINDCTGAYNGGTDQNKRKVVASIIDKITESGGRFLKEAGSDDKNHWEEMSTEEIRKKVMQSFRNRRRQDGESRQFQNHGTLIADEPTGNDVIFGKFHLRHRGTEFLHKLIMNKFEEYESLDRGVKMKVVNEIIQTIKEQNGRFLIPAAEAGKWIEVSKDKVKERISKCFRNFRRKRNH